MLVIIGLIVGGVLTGQTLIAAAGVRAQITQIEKYNTAANTFFTKYGYLPGDIPAVPAAQFGFRSRGTQPGQGDGNGILQACGSCDYQAAAWGFLQNPGEPVMFWEDLSAAHLIEGSFTTADSSTYLGAQNITGTALNLWFPAAMLGNGNYVYAYSPTWQFNPPFNMSVANYFGVSVISAISGTENGAINSAPGMTVSQAAAIDFKIDDGFPQTGRILAVYLTAGNVYWTDGISPMLQAANTGATSGSPITCYDNGNVSGTQKYSLAQNNGAGVNCALSFRMQAGD